MTLKFRIGKLEAAPALRGFTSSKAVREAQDLATIRNRCVAIAEVTDDEVVREQMVEVIRKIDAGEYPLPAPLPTNLDERAKAMRQRMVERFCNE